MTVKPIRETTQERRVLSEMVMERNNCNGDQERRAWRRGGGERRKKRESMEENGVMVHSQVLRIREEESHIGEEIGDDAIGFVDHVVFLTKQILPSSPLSRRAALN